MDISTFSLFHLKLGACCALGIWSALEFLRVEQSNRSVWEDPLFSLLIGLGDYILLLWMWGASVYVWRIHKINYATLLTLDTTEDQCFLQQATGNSKHNGPSSTSTTNSTVAKQSEMGIFEEAIDLSIAHLFTIAIFTQQSRLNLEYKIALARGPVAMDPVDVGSGAASEGKMSTPYYQYSALFPVLFTAWFVYKLMTPWNKRRHYFMMLYKVCTAPFHPVFFVDSYVGDILTSLVKVLVRTVTMTLFALIYTVSLIIGAGHDRVAVYHAILESPIYRFGVVPLITLLPLWLRLVQCLRRANETSKRFPHFCNGLKYASAFTVIAFVTFQPSCTSNGLWVLGFVGATIFQYTWDITMDWGLIEATNITAGTCTAGVSADVPCTSRLTALLSGFRIRSELLLRPVGLYPLIMIVNLLLRFSWTLTLIPDGRYAGSLHSQPLLHVLFAYLAPIMAAVEIMRRMIWGFIRVEWEHIAVKNSQGSAAKPEVDGMELGVGTDKKNINGIGERNDIDSFRMDMDSNHMEKMSLNTSADVNHGGFFSSFANSVSQIALPYVLQHAFTYLVVQFDFVSSFVAFSSSSSIFVESCIFGLCVLIILLTAAWSTIV